MVQEVNKVLNITVNGEQQLLTEDVSNGRIKIDKHCLPDNILKIQLFGSLALQLGFVPEENILNYDVSPDVSSLDFGLPDQMLIYCDLIKPQLIGHESAQVLQIVKCGEKILQFGGNCLKEYTTLHYVPVLIKEFEAITIDIRDHTGGNIPFRHGILTVKLHFKELLNKEQQKNELSNIGY